MRKYRILELVITRDQTRNALHAPSRSLQESPQEGTAGTEPRTVPVTLVPEVYFDYFHCEGERRNKPLVESGY